MNPDDINPPQPNLHDNGTQFLTRAVIVWFVLFWGCVVGVVVALML